VTQEDVTKQSDPASSGMSTRAARPVRRKIRLIGKIDVKGTNVIKGIHMEGLRVVGKPQEMCRRYANDGIDELIFIDLVASLYERSYFLDLINEVSQEIFVPLVVGGGVRSIDDFRTLLRAGADKVAINTQAIKTPGFLHDAALVFGSQCVVLSIAAKRQRDGRWEAWCEHARQPTGLDVIEWAKKAVDLGAGEILVTSIDMDGIMRGMDIELFRTLSESVSVPVIAASGVGTVNHIVECVRQTQVSAIALGSILHFNHETVQGIKSGLIEQGVGVRHE